MTALLEQLPLAHAHTANDEPFMMGLLADEQEAIEVAEAAIDDEPPDAPCWPTADDPLCGLEHLSALAVVGAQRLRDLAAEPIQWAWRDYVVEGTITVIAGPSGGGKTSAIFLWLLARATIGQPIETFGRRIEPGPPGRYVVLIEGEHGEKSAARKLVKSARILGLGDDALGRVILVARKGVTIGSDAWKDVETMIAAGIVSDVVIDTLARCAPGNANDEKEQAQIFDQVAQAIEKGPDDAQPTIWIVAHTRKLNGNKISLDDVSGSVQRIGQADTVIAVMPVRDENGRVIASSIILLKPREEPEGDYPEPLTLTIERDTLRVECGRDSEAPKLPDNASPLDRKILTYLHGQKVLRAANYIAKAVDRSNSDVSKRLEILEQVGHVERAENGVEYKGRYSDGYRISGPWADEDLGTDDDDQTESPDDAPTPDVSPDE